MTKEQAVTFARKNRGDISETDPQPWHYWQARMAARFAFCSLSPYPDAAFAGRAAATRANQADVDGARMQAILAVRLAR